jgi:hypothetical protein
MTKKIMLFVLASFCISLTAGIFGNENETIPQSQFLCYDRIRNVIAVDNSPQRHFFVATFGLDNYDESSTTPPREKKQNFLDLQ